MKVIWGRKTPHQLPTYSTSLPSSPQRKIHSVIHLIITHLFHRSSFPQVKILSYINHSIPSVILPFPRSFFHFLSILLFPHPFFYSLILSYPSRVTSPPLLSSPGQEIELGMHDGTVRDMCFVEDASNKSSLLISGGAGDCKIYVTDCATGTPFQALSGHTGTWWGTLGGEELGGGLGSEGVSGDLCFVGELGTILQVGLGHSTSGGLEDWGTGL